jgi:hypothetical protein
MALIEEPSSIENRKAVREDGGRPVVIFSDLHFFGRKIRGEGFAVR